MKRSIAMATLALIVGVSLTGCNQAEVPESESNTYKITFVQSGQNNVGKEVNEGETLSEVPEPFPKTGYTVTWSRTDFSNITENLTVNAVETANEYTITYEPGEGTLESLTQKVTYDSSYTLSTPISTNELSNFLYWKRTDGTSVVQNGMWKIAEDITLTAVYSEVYTVAFVQNGQEAILRQVGQNGTLTDIPEPSPKTGYTVTWDRTDFTNITGNLTVNAVEAANEYTITYDPGEGTLENLTQKVTYDSSYTLSTPTSTNELSNFLCWKCTDGTSVVQNGIWKIAEDITLTAVYSKVYTVAFVQNGQEAILRQVGQNGTLTDIPKPSLKTGYTVMWDRKDFTNITESLTVNAVETANEYKITYTLGEHENDANAEIESREQTVRYDSPYALYIPECNGYKFVKWVITGSNKEIKDGTWSIADDVSLTAVWEIDKDSDHGWSGIY